MARGRDYPTVDPGTPVGEAAAVVVASLAKTVSKAYDLAATRADEDVEHVHQLRVACRRLGAAMRAFSGALPKGDRKRVARHLRDIRQSAGQARDLDVFLIALQAWAVDSPADSQPAVLYLTGWATGGREVAQGELVRLHGSEPPKNLLKAGRALAAGAECLTDAPSFGELGASQVSRQVAEVSARLAEGSLDNSELHQIRIQTKRLRYTLELFQSAIDPDAYARLLGHGKHLQESLGGLLDSDLMIDRLQLLRSRLEDLDRPLWELVDPGMAQYMDFHRARRSEFCDGFERDRFSIAAHLMEDAAKLG